MESLGFICMGDGEFRVYLYGGLESLSFIWTGDGEFRDYLFGRWGV